MLSVLTYEATILLAIVACPFFVPGTALAAAPVQPWALRCRLPPAVFALLVAVKTAERSRARCQRDDSRNTVAEDNVIGKNRCRIRRGAGEIRRTAARESARARRSLPSL